MSSGLLHIAPPSFQFPLNSRPAAAVSIEVSLMAVTFNSQEGGVFYSDFPRLFSWDEQGDEPGMVRRGKKDG
jgi:hypothetical protein